MLFKSEEINFVKILTMFKTNRKRINNFDYEFEDLRYSFKLNQKVFDPEYRTTVADSNLFIDLTIRILIRIRIQQKKLKIILESRFWIRIWICSPVECSSRLGFGSGRMRKKELRYVIRIRNLACGFWKFLLWNRAGFKINQIPRIRRNMYLDPVNSTKYGRIRENTAYRQ
jgi:hypothetical protein